MVYVKFLCLGLGLLSLVAGMICGLVGIVSHEPIVKFKAKRLAIVILPVALMLLTLGLQMTFGMLLPTP